jgi:hypothetical protein
MGMPFPVPVPASGKPVVYSMPGANSLSSDVALIEFKKAVLIVRGRKKVVHCATNSAHSAIKSASVAGDSDL